MRNELRKNKIQVRNNLTSAEHDKFSQQIVEQILLSDAYHKAQNIMIYRAVKGEVDLRTLEAAAKKDGKALYYPLCISKTEMIALLAGVANIDFVQTKPAGAIGTVGTGFEAFIIVDESINKEQLLARFKKLIETETGYVKKSEAKLSGKFVEHAPKEVVDAEKEKLEESKRKIEKLNSYIESL